MPRARAANCAACGVAGSGGERIRRLEFFGTALAINDPQVQSLVAALRVAARDLASQERRRTTLDRQKLDQRRPCTLNVPPPFSKARIGCSDGEP